VAFLGEPRAEAAKHPHESPGVMTVPLILLAIPSVLAGYQLGGIGIKSFYYNWAAGVTGTAVNVAPPEIGFALGEVVPALMVLAGVALAFVLYRGCASDPLHIRVLAKKFYFDEFYDNELVGGTYLFARALSWIDYWILDGLIIRGAAYLSVGAGELFKLFQTGSLQTYAFILSLGGGLIIYFTLFSH
jgi:NADH-quinone oxidoreductase subunit L